MKRILLSFMLLVSTITMFAYDFEVDGIYYNITSEDKLECEVTNRGSGSYSGIVNINSKVTYNSKEYSVTTIGDDAFNYCRYLTSVSISSSVTSIGSGAFSQCNNLTSITIPYSVTTIGDDAFNSCVKLSSITIPSSVSSIGSRAFRSCYNLTSITIPSSVTSIGSNAFEYCYNLTSLEIPESVVSIGDRAFHDCNKLETIIVNDNNQYYCVEDNVLFNKDKTELILSLPQKEGAYSIPNSVKKICDAAFSRCDKLTSILIPNSVTHIGHECFYGCGVHELTIPDSVKYVGDNCFSLSNINKIIIGSSVEYIGEYPFRNCPLRNIIFKDGEKRLKAFLPDPPSWGMRNMSMFDGISELDTLYLGRRLRNNESYVYNTNAPFYNSTIHNLTIGSSCRVIGYGLFCGAVIDNICIKEGLDSIDGRAFSSCKIKNMQLPESTTYLGQYSFAASDISRIGFGSNLNKIDNYAFEFCEKLQEIILPNTINVIGYYAFRNCKRLKHIKVNQDNGNENIEWSNNNYISGQAFQDCDSLLTAEIPAGINDLGHSIFSDCNQLRKLVICDAETELRIPDIMLATALSFGKGKFAAFENCPLDTVYIGRNMKFDTYQGTSGSPFDSLPIKHVEFGNSVTRIESKMFYNNDSIRDIKLPVNVETIGYDAFGECDNLESIRIPSKTKHIADNALYNCKSLTTVFCDAIEPPVVTSTTFPKSQVVINVPKESLHNYRTSSCWSSYVIQSEGMDEELITLNLTEGQNIQEILNEKNLCPSNINRLKIVGELTDKDWSYLKDSLKFVNYLDVKDVTNINIPKNQFKDHIYLRTCVLPVNLSSIGDYAFQNCENLRGTLRFNYLSTIGQNAFQGSKIDSLFFSPENGHVTVGMNAFQHCDSLKYLKAGVNCTFSPNAFEYCSCLSDIDIAEGANLMSYVFHGCQNINKITLRNATLNPNTFHYCQGLTEVTFEGKSFIVPKDAFNKCTALHKLIFIKDVLGSSYADFTDLAQLDTIVSYALVPPTSKGFNETVYDNATLIVPELYASNYENDAIWGRFLNRETMTQPTVALGDVDCDGKLTLKDITLTIDYYLGKKVYILEVAADINGNGQIDIIDITEMIGMYLQAETKTRPQR